MKRASIAPVTYRNHCLAKAAEANMRAGSAGDLEYRAKWNNVADIWRYVASRSDSAPSHR